MLDQDLEQRTSLLDASGVMERLNVSQAMLYKLVAARQFPKPIKIGRAARWPDVDVEKWIREKMSQR